MPQIFIAHLIKGEIAVSKSSTEDGIGWQEWEALNECVKNGWSVEWICIIDTGSPMTRIPIFQTHNCCQSLPLHETQRQCQIFSLVQVWVFVHNQPVCAKTSNSAFLFLDDYNLRLISYHLWRLAKPSFSCWSYWTYWDFSLLHSWCCSIKVDTTHLIPAFCNMCLWACPFFFPLLSQSCFQDQDGLDVGYNKEKSEKVKRNNMCISMKKHHYSIY